jgi:hypothetical protein
MKTKTNYQVTFGYKAIITIDVKSDSEGDAKKQATEILKISRDRMFRANDVTLQDDNFKPDGILNMDETWNQF